MRSDPAHRSARCDHQPLFGQIFSDKVSGLPKPDRCSVGGLIMSSEAVEFADAEINN